MVEEEDTFWCEGSTDESRRRMEAKEGEMRNLFSKRFRQLRKGAVGVCYASGTAGWQERR